MASDKRAARLGVLAAVAVMLFSGLGARLWFLQTVEAQSLQQVVDQRNTRTVLIAPERGQIFDHDGRLLAGNEPIYNIAVDWAAMSRAADRAALFSRLSGWVGVPVEEMEARYDSGDFRPLRPLPIAEDVPENVVIALERAQRGLPRRDDGRVVPPGLSLRPARRPRRRLHGGDHRRRRRPLQTARLRHVEPWRGGRPGRRRAGVRDDAPRAVGGDRLRGRLARQHRSRDQPHGSRQRDGHPVVHRPRPPAVRRAAAADPAAPQAGVHGAQPDRREARRHAPADVAEPRDARVLRGAGRLGDRR